MKDEDLDRCPRCKEDMRSGNDLCRNCQREDELVEWPGGDSNPFCNNNHQDDLSPPDEFTCSECGFVTDDPETRHYCCEDNSNE